MKIGLLSMPLSGHLNPMAALGKKLQSRGHEVKFIGLPDVEPFALAANLDFIAYGEQEYPLGSISRDYAQVAGLHGTQVTSVIATHVSPKLTQYALDYLEEKIVRYGIAAMVIDTIYFYGELVPMHLNIPYIHLWAALHYDFSGNTPASVLPYPFDPTPEGKRRNLEGLRWLGEEVAVPSLLVAQRYAAKVGLKVDWMDPAATTSKLAIIAQTPGEFDLPGIELPPQFHYAGPLQDDNAREPIDFPWNRLTEKPLIYASLGTLVNGIEPIYRVILETIRRMPDLQLVLSVGNNLDLESLGSVPDNTIVVRRAPQIEMLKRSALCITHAGLNTTLESLTHGVPMVAIPIAFDQPGNALRISFHEVGESLTVDDLSADRLYSLVEKVMAVPSYRENARKFQSLIARSNGLDVAADILERAFSKVGVNETPLVAVP
jgi:zeaxanthin glucosyltransferase